jgi:Rieske Fe-S protein
MASEPESESEKPEALKSDRDAVDPVIGGAAAAADDPDRRDFLVKAGSVFFGGLVVAVPVGAGLMTFISPLMRKSDGGLVVRLAAVADLPADGTPKRFDVVGEKDDAWMKYPSKPIGGVYLRRMPDGGVIAFNSSCPHAGCSVGFRPEQGGFYCPCHKSEFEIDGTRGEHCVSARDMDTLEIDPEKLKAGEIWVTFMNFRAGIADKKVVS